MATNLDRIKTIESLDLDSFINTVLKYRNDKYGVVNVAAGNSQTIANKAESQGEKIESPTDAQFRKPRAHSKKGKMHQSQELELTNGYSVLTQEEVDLVNN